MARIGAYGRISTDKTEQLQSLENQRSYFRNYAESNGYTLVDFYYDEGVSGTSIKKRNGFNRMIDDAQNGKLDFIVTKDVSRFARNTVDTLNYTRRLKQCGVGVIFISDNINTLEPDGEFRLTIMASLAQEESHKISERVKWGQRQSMKKGVVFGRSMLGYDVKDGRLYIEPNGAKIVRLIFHKYVNEKKGTHIIARELLQEGYYPLNVKKWSNTVILKILRNEKYVGDLCQQKTYTPDYLTHSKKYNKNEVEKVYIENHHEPIIERGLWNLAQEELKKRILTDEQKSRHSCRYWCSGKIVCGECGEKFVSRIKRNKNGSIRKSWRCGNYVKYGTAKLNHVGDVTGCNSKSVNEQILVEAVKFILNYLNFNKKEIVSEMVNEINLVVNNHSKTDVKSFYSDISRIQKKKNILLDSYIEGVISKDDYKRQNEFYDEEISEMQRKINSKECICLEVGRQEVKIQKCIEYMNKYLNFENANEYLLNEIIEKITVFKDKTLIIKIKYLPFVTLKYCSSGKGDNYTTKFEVVKN